MFAFLVKDKQGLSLVLSEHPLLSFEAGLYMIKYDTGRTSKNFMVKSSLVLKVHRCPDIPIRRVLSR